MYFIKKKDMQKQLPKKMNVLNHARHWIWHKALLVFAFHLAENSKKYLTNKNPNPNPQNIFIFRTVQEQPGMCEGLLEVLTWTEIERQNQIRETFHWGCTNHVGWAKHLVEFAAY